MESKRNDGDYENDNDLEMGSLPNFIPKGAPDVKPPEAVAVPQPAGDGEAPQKAGDVESAPPSAGGNIDTPVEDGEALQLAGGADASQPSGDAASLSAYEDALNRFVSTGKQGHTEKYGRALLDEILAEIASGKGADPTEARNIQRKLVHYGFAEAWGTAPKLYAALSEEHAQRAAMDPEATQEVPKDDALGKSASAPEAAAALNAAPPAATADVLADVSKALLAAVQETTAAQGANVHQAARAAQPGAPMSGGGAEAAQSGLRSLAEGGLGLVGGLASLAGTVGRGVGGAARTLASAVEARRQAGASFADAAPRRVAPGISVLPKISEYRVKQAEEHANAYQNSLDKFWASGKLPDVWEAIEERAQEIGTSAADVLEKMVPGGEMEDLRAQFLDAVGESPEAQESKKGMDRALDSWVRQYSRGSEELLNPETAESEEYDTMRERFEGTQAKMADLVTQSPVFGGEEKSHAQKFREAVERIAKKIQELLERVNEFIRGRNPAPEQQREEPGYEP